MVFFENIIRQVSIKCRCWFSQQDFTFIRGRSNVSCLTIILSMTVTSTGIYIHVVCWLWILITQGQRQPQKAHWFSKGLKKIEMPRSIIQSLSTIDIGGPRKREHLNIPK